MPSRNSGGSTSRVSRLLEALKKRALSDRSSEWFTDEMFADIVHDEEAQFKPIIKRRALAFKEMLAAMAHPENSKRTRTFQIRPGELIVGTMPLGSLGLGKVFPNYLTETEKKLAFFCSRGVESNLGHNSPDFAPLLSKGLKDVIRFCNERIKYLKVDRDYPMGRTGGIIKKIGFYEAVKICCESVCDFANEFSALASAEVSKAGSAARAAELEEIARICSKVPFEPADTFHEALQSIWFVHLAYHASVSHLSLGRLDQLLQPYLEKSLPRDELNHGEALELIECFFIKAAERLNLNPAYFEKQDHADFGTGMGHSPFLLDQEGTVNQFMQNIVIGGLTPEGKDAVNTCSYLFLDACASLGLSTPTINVRLHENSPDHFKHKVAECIMNSRNGQPIIYNDDTIVPALMYAAGKYNKPTWNIREARDYVVDGCWEVILNGKSDFTYNMVNILTALECALNGGALLSNSSMQLSGEKKSFGTKPPSEMKRFDDLKQALSTHIRLFTTKAGMEIYDNYYLEGSVTPAPLLSAFLGNCLVKGIDKTWGGADHRIGGIVFIALPNVANSLAAIKKWVFEEKAYTLPEVVRSLRNNYAGSGEMRLRFRESPKFGNNDRETDGIMAWLMEEIVQSIAEAQELANQLFLTIPRGSKEGRRISALRNMAGYSGISMKERFGKDFKIDFTIGCGTFAQYVFFGLGCAASADGRCMGDPVAPNFSPASGSATHGAGAILESMKDLKLDRFGCGVITDICMEKTATNPEMIKEIIRKFMACNGNILSLTIADHSYLAEIYEHCNAVREGTEEPSVLDRFENISVRVGGWNSAFITLTKKQQEDYLKRTQTGI